MGRLVVVSNRTLNPQEHDVSGGLAVGVLSALKKKGGLWFGWSGQVSSDNNQQVKHSRFENIDYATIDLDQNDYQQYYLGFCNSVLWPLLHFFLNQIKFKQSEYQRYLKVNHLFAKHLVDELREDDMLWVHDYHFMPLARNLRVMGCKQKTGLFLHVPFPSFQVFRTLPVWKQILEYLCEFDAIGFQTENDRQSFMECIENGLSLPVAKEGFYFNEKIVKVSVFPIGIDCQHVASLCADSEGHDEACFLQDSIKQTETRKLIIGADRLDYSKGLIERIHGYKSMLDTFPEMLRKTVMLQISQPSRTEIDGYQQMKQQLQNTAGAINAEYGTADWTPIRYVNSSYEQSLLFQFFRISHVGLITSLRDGMNLVAKEYIAAQDVINPGVLVLSEFTGAAEELSEAVLVNPYDNNSIAQGLYQALNMPILERQLRHQTMLKHLKINSVHVWASNFIDFLESSGQVAIVSAVMNTQRQRIKKCPVLQLNSSTNVAQLTYYSS